MNKTEGEEHASGEAQTSYSLVSIFSRDPAGTTKSPQLRHGGSSVWLIGSGTVEKRRSQPGVQERGQSPAVFFSLPLLLLCKCTSNAYDLSVFFSHAMISLFLIPSYSPAHSFYLFPSIFVSVTLAFPTARPAFISVPLPP